LTMPTAVLLRASIPRASWSGSAAAIQADRRADPSRQGKPPQVTVLDLVFADG
jgi:hypothetical protein